MQDDAVTHTRQKLGSVSFLRVLEAAERAAKWEPGAPAARGASRGDLHQDGARAPCALGARFAVPDATPTTSEVA
jgi:hypothetical protein